MNPREMFIEGLLAFEYPGNCRKRVDRIDRLALAVGAEISYGLNFRGVCIESGGSGYEANSLRDAERLLRCLKRAATVAERADANQTEKQ